jgi:hypothetical protein
MPWKLFGWLGKYRDAAILMVIGSLIVPYTLKKTVEALEPIFTENHSVRKELKEEVHQAEVRSKEYANEKHAEVLRAINRLDGNVAGINKRLDKFLEDKPRKTAERFVRESETKN